MPRLNNLTQYFTDAGAPLAAGLLYTYEPGTTTPQTTYSDSAMTTPNANPVVLSASGRQPDVYFDGSVKVVLKDSDGVTIDTVDPVSGETMTGAEIKAAYEAEADTNAFTNADHTKLDGIEASADVTDATNVMAALDGASIPNATILAADKVLFQDASDSDALKQDDAQTLANLYSASSLDYTFSGLANGEYVGTYFTTTATGSGVSQFDAVVISALGVTEAGVVTASNATVIGIATAAAAASASVDVLTHGMIKNTSWSWTVGGEVYNSASGGLSQTKTGSGGYSCRVGIAVASNVLFVNPGEWTLQP